jgi:hypothetical protein
MAREQATSNDDDDVHLVLEQHVYLDFYKASSMKQQAAVRHDAPLRHINCTLSQQVFAPTHKCCMLSRKVVNTNLIVFGLT